MRNEYPRPSLVRERWLNLNGEWEFEIAAKGDNLVGKESYSRRINVPFCPESELSAVGYKGFTEHLYYRRAFDISEQEREGRILMYFGAVDYRATVYINKKVAGEHKGGYVGFCIDITDYVVTGKNVVDVEVEDDTRDICIPSGKQSMKEDSYGCYYTRTTGIWQTVWLEFVGKSYVSGVKIDADPKRGIISLRGKTVGVAGELGVKVRLYGDLLADDKFKVNGGEFDCNVLVSQIELWGPENPALYDIELTLSDGEKEADKLFTYTAFRTFEVRGKEFFLNGRRIFLKQVLDQGFYPEGVYTAPSARDIERDIDESMKLGFNGARPHQKVFEERYLYYADKKGYLLWGEYPSWGAKFTSRYPRAVNNLIEEWKEILARDYNHPSIIGWCPLNEAWRHSVQDTDKASVAALERVTREEGGNRVFVGASGGKLYAGDVNDIHSYEHSVEKLRKRLTPRSGTWQGFFEDLLFASGKGGELTHAERDKMPVFLSEYGGASYLAGEGDWGYHEAMTSEEEFIALFRALTEAAYDMGVAGVCYTQLYDVEQECNGLLRYDRSAKLSEEGRRAVKEILDKLV